MGQTDRQTDRETDGLTDGLQHRFCFCSPYYPTIGWGHENYHRRSLLPGLNPNPNQKGQMSATVVFGGGAGVLGQISLEGLNYCQGFFGYNSHEPGRIWTKPGIQVW